MKPDDKVDFGTPELAKRLNVVPTLTRGQYGYNGKIVDETEIDRLLLHDRILPADHSILEKLLGKLLKANFVGVRSPSYEARVSADPSAVGDRRANQIRSVVGLFKRMDREIGQEKRKALVNLVLLDEPWNGDDASLLDAVRALGRLL